MDNSVNNQMTKGADGRVPVPPAGRADAGGISVRLPGDAGDRSLGDRATMPGAAGADASLGDARTMRPGGAGAAGRRFREGELLLGRYRVVGELGQGGMGVVYRCSDETAGIEVALKALPPEVARSSGEMEEVRANFRLVEKLHHPNIANVKTLERDPESGDCYLVMELVDGYDVRQWVRRRKEEGRPLTLDEVTIIAYRIAEALDYAHGEGVVHRDIKPSNVRVDFAGNVKVLDFGLAAQISTSRSRVSQVSAQGTGGTAPYMAPEQWRGRRQGAAADQYALAATVYELLEGAPPFEGSDPVILREAVLSDTPAPVAGAPEHVNAALLRALSKEPEARFASCGAFVKALAAREGSGLGVLGSEVGGRKPEAGAVAHAETRRRGGRNTALWLVGAAGVAVLAYGAYRAYEAHGARRAAESRAEASRREAEALRVSAGRREAELTEAARKEKEETERLRLSAVEEKAKAEAELARLRLALSPGVNTRPGTAADAVTEEINTKNSLAKGISQNGQFSLSAEPWRDALEGPETLVLEKNVDRVPEGLVFECSLSKRGGASAYLCHAGKRNCAVRLLAVHDSDTGVQIIREANTSPNSNFALRLSRNGEVTLSQFVYKTEQNTVLGRYKPENFPKRGETYEMELRVVGTKLTCKLNGTVLGTVQVPQVTQGRYLVGLFNGGRSLVRSLHYLPLPDHDETSMTPPTYSASVPQSNLPSDLAWTNSLGMVFVPVPGTKVRFSIWDTRVQDYQAYVAATGRSHEAKNDPSYEQGPTHPVSFIGWRGCKAFCSWLTEKERREGRISAGQYYRLPTDLEWSTAVGLKDEPGSTAAGRNGKVRDVYPWGTTWPPPRGAGNYGKKWHVDDFEHTSPVGSFAPNQFGLYDMGGNVNQWCDDREDGMYIMRGGSWKTSRQEDALLSRRWFWPRDTFRDPGFGFRCVLASSL